jgi:hypothetical protein
MEVEARGRSLRVSVNGQEVVSTDLDSFASRINDLPGLGRQSGRIGFQNWQGTVRFRNIRLRELDVVSSNSPAPETEITLTAAASADPSRPTLLNLGTIAKGRVDPRSRTNQAHYWLVDLPAGEYKAVVDMERSDRRNSNIQGNLSWLGVNGKDQGGWGPSTKSVSAPGARSCSGSTSREK